jgi:hypothetical protein
MLQVKDGLRKRTPRAVPAGLPAGTARPAGPCLPAADAGDTARV